MFHFLTVARKKWSRALSTSGERPNKQARRYPMIHVNHSNFSDSFPHWQRQHQITFMVGIYWYWVYQKSKNKPNQPRCNNLTHPGGTYPANSNRSDKQARIQGWFSGGAGPPKCGPLDFLNLTPLNPPIKPPFLVQFKFVAKKWTFCQIGGASHPLATGLVTSRSDFWFCKYCC